MPRATHPSRLTHPSLQTQILFYGGKGGVGKTTCAAARAVAEGLRGRRVLLVSTDPAHSLSDALAVRLSSKPSRVAVGRGRFMDAVELDAPRAFERWLASHRDALREAIEHGTWLDREDADALLDLPLPGVDELIGLIEIVRLAAVRQSELTVVDTAPTGHMLRLLAAPGTVAAVSDVLDLLQEEHRIVRRQFGRIERPEAADRAIALIASEAADITSLLRDSSHVGFDWVMLPEELSLAESRDGMAALEHARVHVRGITVNRVMPGGPACMLCDRRRRAERRIVARIRRLPGKLPIRVVFEEAAEPRGAAALARIGRSLAARLPSPLPQEVNAPGAARFRHDARAKPIARHVGPETVPVFAGARVLFFGGKGGVGKTTVAAAVALRMARANPSSRVLLISTDPAHSIGDVLKQRVSDRPSTIRGAPRNLRVRELDAQTALRSAQVDIEGAISEILRVTGGPAIGSRPGESASSRVVELAPPGMDELFGLLALVQVSREVPVNQLIVVDTAPAGHTLRLLEMPEIARQWVQTFLKVLLKYSAVARPGRLARELVDLSKSIRRLSSMLRDPVATRFVVVTRAGEVPRLETNRLIRRLDALHLAVPAVVANALTPTLGSCPRCRRTAAGENRVLQAIRRQCGRRGCVIIQTPLVAPPPRGAAALERWAGQWLE
jgi:arsenite-transporting ATPase